MHPINIQLTDWLNRHLYSVSSWCKIFEGKNECKNCVFTIEISSLHDFPNVPDISRLTKNLAYYSSS